MPPRAEEFVFAAAQSEMRATFPAMRSLRSATHLPLFESRLARFEDVPPILRLIRRAIERGCRNYYGQRQRGAVHATYVGTMFVEAVGPFVTLVAEREGRLVAVAQFDPVAERLRALFVDADVQQRGVGTHLLADVEACAISHGCSRVVGAMSLNAVPFYLKAGFRAAAQPENLKSAGVWVPILRMEKQLPQAASLLQNQGQQRLTTADTDGGHWSHGD